ncbi:MAG: sigma-70 family RNA polymerase sigma factor [Christensenellaceae bacterium]
MLVSHEHKERTVHMFDAFCKMCMHFQALNCYRTIQRKNEREVSLNYLAEKGYFGPTNSSGYSINQSIPTNFRIKGETCTIQNEKLAIALSRLTAEKRELILLRYFIGYKDGEIAVIYERAHVTISYRKRDKTGILRLCDIPAFPFAIRLAATLIQFCGHTVL